MYKYDQIYHSLCEQITQILDHHGTALPTEERLCRTYQISRQTLRKALSRLENEHVLISRQGSSHALTGLYPGRTNQIVLMVHYSDVYLTPQRISRITGFFAGLHYQVLVMPTGASRKAEGDILEKLVSTPPRGLFVESISNALPTPYVHLYQRLQRAGTAIVFLGERYPNLFSGYTAMTDDPQGAYEMTEYLIGQGHHSIGTLLLADDQSSHGKYLGFAQAMHTHRIPLPDVQVQWITLPQLEEIRQDRSLSMLRRILEGYPQQLTALLCQNDELAFLVIRALRMIASRDHSICVTGFDNSYLHETGTIHFPTMETPSLSLYACEQMLRCLRNLPPLADKLPWKRIGAGQSAGSL